MPDTDFFNSPALDAPLVVAPVLVPTPEIQSPQPPALPDEEVAILGVRIANITRARAIELIEQKILADEGKTHSIYFVNAHTLNLATADRAYRRVLNSADYVFGDGTGVRWAARLGGIRMQANLVGTDLVPALFETTAGKGYRYFMLGADEATVTRAAAVAREKWPGWVQAGYHHGYLSNAATTDRAIEQINASRPDVLLVGMGNPRQERWIAEHREALRVPVCLGIGGLYDYWAENVSRAPDWLRRAGHEWLWRLWQQPRDKAHRYLVGNPLFLARIVAERLRQGVRLDDA